MQSRGSHKWILIRLFSIVMLLVPLAPSSIALDDDTEEELIKQAEDLFKDEMYLDAFPLFSQLLSLYPDNINYNLKFSVCMLYADEEKSKSISYLEKVTKNLSSDKIAFYYLGYAYHLNYQFKKAITAYNTFKSSGSKKDLEKFSVDRQIQMCENGLTLLRTKSELGVISKTEIKETEYFRTYDMELLTGKILVKPNDFKTSNDIDKEEESLVYLGKNAKMLFYSSYGKAGENRDLYMVIKKPGGAWGTAQRLPDYINSPYDENYPVMHPNQNVLYFSSKGHNSMGGYDIFKARYDSTTNRWSKPVNLDFPINSADDDILYLPTQDERTAFFSSSRSSVQGKISVYKIMLKEAPGRFTSTGEPEIASSGTSEPLAIEDILAEASLDVNAKEEDFAVSSTEPAASSASTSTPSESMQAESFIDLTDDQLVDVGFEYAENIKKDEQRLRNEADASFQIAREKKQQATAKTKEAEAIRSRLANISDTKQKEVAQGKADKLDKDSKKLEKEADIAFEFAKTLTTEAETRKEQSETAAVNAEKIKTAMASNQKDESISILIDQKVMAQSIESSPSGVAQKSKDTETQARIKEAEAGEAYEKIQFMESELVEIDNDVKTLLEQADRTKDAVIKEEILAQAQELEAEKQDTETELARTYTEAETLNKEARDLRDEADLLSGVSNEILASSESSTTASSSASSSNTATTSGESSVEETPVTSDPIVSIEETATSLETSTGVATEPSTEESSETASSSTDTEPDEATTSLETAPDESFDITPESIGEAITEDNIVEEMIAVEELEIDAENYEKEAKSIREKAESADPAFRENAIKEAEKFELAATKKRTQAASATALINTYTFKTTVKQYGDLQSGNRYLTAQDLQEVKGRQTEASGKFDRAQEMRKAAETVNDPADKVATLKEAEKLEVEAIASLEQINNSLNYKENKGEIAQKNRTVGTMESDEVLEISKFYEESDNLYTQARGLRANAETIDDPAEKAEAFRRADALEKQAIEVQQTAINLHEFYRYQGVLFEAVKTARSMPTEDQESLDVLASEYTALTAEAKTVRTNAESLDDPEEIVIELHKANELETQALEKQRTALNIYFESDEEIAELLGEEPSSETSRASNAGTTPDSSDPLISVEPSTSSTESSSSGTTENIGARTTQPQPEGETSSTITISSSDPRTADELIADSEAKQEKAQQLYESIELIEDPDAMMAALNEAETLEAQADAEMARAKQLDPGNETIVSEAARASGQDPSTSTPLAESSSASISPTESSSTFIEPESTTSSEGSTTTDGTSPEELLATSTNEETSTSTTTDTGTEPDQITSEETEPFTTSTEESGSSTDATESESSTPTSSEEEFSISETGESTIEYVDDIGSEPESPTSYEASTTETTFTGSQARESVAELSVDEPLEEDIFAVTEMISYTPANPIPVNAIIPSGLLFKVQIGAFRNPIPQNLFKGINPIMGEKTGMGFIRYSAGLFRMLSSAEEAKGVIRGMGYNDAFVVAFYNGVRVSIDDARRMLADGTVPQPIASRSASTGTSTVGTMGSTSGSPSSSVPGTTDISTITELFYTVQVGVYSKPSNVGDKFNLNDLYTFRTSNGYIRYNHGRFSSASDAENQKEGVVAKGISDAFVTAYYNGKRISLTQARSLPATSFTETSTPEPRASEEVEPTPSEVINEEPAPSPEEEAPSISMDTDEKLEEGDAVDFSIDLPAKETVYMVKIGQYAKDVPVDEATKFLDIKDLGIEIYTIGDTSVYTVGEFIHYEEAEMLRMEVEIRGIEDPDIVVFYEERIMSVGEYLRKTLK